jgi:phosphonate ABC transporter permease subunit PhnE
VNNNPPSSRSALRRLLLVLAVLAGVAFYAYGWNTTHISLNEVQDPTRQASVQRAMRELLSPDIFTRNNVQRSLFVEFPIGCPAGEQPEGRVPVQGSDQAYVIFTPPCADTEAVINVKGYNFPADAIARIQLYREGEQSLPFNLATGTGAEATASNEAIFDIDSAGYFNVNVVVPKGRGISGQVQQIEIQSAVPTGWPKLSDTTHTVINRMIETIFLALMATSLALPIAIGLSFLAARNLMRQISLPLGNVLVGFVLLPVGGLMGAVVLGPVGKLGVDWGKDLLPGVIGSAVVIAGFAVLSRFANQIHLTGLAGRIRDNVVSALLLVVIVFTFGAVGGVGIWVGSQLFDVNTKIEGHDSLGLNGSVGEEINAVVDAAVSVKNIAGFIDTLGTLTDLIIIGVAAFGGALWLASVGATMAAGPMRHVYAPLSNILGALLGFASGAILLTAAAYIGAQAVLFRLLTPLVAGVLGGELLVLGYRRFVGGMKLKRDRTDADQAIYSALFLIGAVLAFALTGYLNDLLRAIVDERPPSELTYNLGLFEIQRYIGRSALIGAVLGGLAGGLSGTQTSFPLGMTIYNTSRTILNALRSIEPLIMGIVFVIWVGVGPFAGVLALTLHSIASLGKLYSEQVENIDAGPIEALQSTGANRLQTIVYAVVPQIVPPYIAFTMYRWDINVRMSTIIGFVGGGGIGFLLQQQINLLRYKQAGVAVLAIAIVVSVLDFASAYIREKII